MIKELTMKKLYKILSLTGFVWSIIAIFFAISDALLVARFNINCLYVDIATQSSSILMISFLTLSFLTALTDIIFIKDDDVKDDKSS
jgi:hypothetical protein